MTASTDNALVAILNVLEDLHSGALQLPIGAVDDLHRALARLAEMEPTS